MKIIKNAFSLYAIQGMGYALNILTLPYLTRTLGVDGYGEFALIIALSQYCVMVTDYGFNLSATKEISAHKLCQADVEKIYTATILAKLILGVFATLVTFIMARYVLNESFNYLVFFVLLFSSLSTILLPVWLYQGLEEFRKLSLIVGLGKIFSAIAVYSIVANGTEAWVSALIYTSTQGLVAFLCYFMQWPQKLPKFVFVATSDVWEVIKKGFNLFIGSVATSLYTTAASIVLSRYATLEVVGQFAIAHKIVYLVQSLLYPIVQATYPRLVALRNEKSGEEAKLRRYIVFFQIGAAVILVVGLYFSADYVSQYLTKGDYGKVSWLVKYMSPIILLGGISYYLGIQTLLPQGNDKYFVSVLVFSGVVFVMGTLITLESGVEPIFAMGSMCLMVEFLIVLLLAGKVLIKNKG